MKEAAELLSGAASRLGPAQLAQRWDSLPDPVRRYLRLAIPDPGAVGDVEAIRVQHRGRFRTGPASPWLPVIAEEYHTVAEPGFVWRARFSPMDLVTLTITDGLRDGHGYGVVHAAGRLPVSTLCGPEVDQSASARWLMEALWFPHAFVGPYIRWEPIDDRSARATLTSINDVNVTMHFDLDSGLPQTVSCQRYMQKAKHPFRGTCCEYRSFAGVLVPTRLTGSWELPEGEFCFVDFEVETLELNPDVPTG